MTQPLRIEVLAIGNELLDGRVADTNTLDIARAIAPLGLSLAHRTTVLDELDAIVAAASAAIARGTQLCVVTGGLGPTRDDITREALATLAGVELVRDPAVVTALEQRFAERGYTLTDNQRRQADLPAGAARIDNPRGTAPGFSLTHAGCRFVALPGVPSELHGMLSDAVIAPLAATLGRDRGQQRLTLWSFGLLEGEVDTRLAPIRERWPEVWVGYRAAFPEIHVTLQAPGSSAAALQEAAALAREALGENLFSESEEGLAATVIATLRRQGATLATAESCTGGLIGDRLTDVPGGSDVYRGGIIAYSNAAKSELLAVPEALLASHGAVSEPVVLAMATGVRGRLGASHGIAVSGIAGPGGGTPEKPVGTVWLAISGPAGERSRMLRLPLDRRRNKLLSAHAGLELLRRAL